MKVWQLASIVRDIEFLISTAMTQPQWSYIGEYYRNFGPIVNQQDRRILNQELPSGYVETVLCESQGVCYLGSDGNLRSYRLNPFDLPLSFLESYRRYGGTKLENVLECGSVNV